MGLWPELLYRAPWTDKDTSRHGSARRDRSISQSIPYDIDTDMIRPDHHTSFSRNCNKTYMCMHIAVNYIQNVTKCDRSYRFARMLKENFERNK